MLRTVGPDIDYKSENGHFRVFEMENITYYIAFSHDKVRNYDWSNILGLFWDLQNYFYWPAITFSLKGDLRIDLILGWLIPLNEFFTAGLMDFLL